MIELRTLQNIEIEELVEVFNLSFSDYILPFKLTKEQLVEKMESENVSLAYSVGAFESGKLIAFILHFSTIVGDEKIVYNGGTGVIPSKRGKELTYKMYEYILPVLKAENVRSIQLEVLTDNAQAIRSYQKVGFEKKRNLACFKGQINPKKTANPAEIREINAYDWHHLASFWDFHPTWQNAIEVMEKLSLTNVAFGAFIKGNLVGYIIFNPKTNRVHQFGVDKAYRKQGIGSQLFAHIAENKEISFSTINIDEKATETIHFLLQLGFENYINQLEMMLQKFFIPPK